MVREALAGETHPAKNCQKSINNHVSFYGGWSYNSRLGSGIVYHHQYVQYFFLVTLMQHPTVSTAMLCKGSYIIGRSIMAALRLSWTFPALWQKSHFAVIFNCLKTSDQ